MRKRPNSTASVRTAFVNADRQFKLLVTVTDSQKQPAPTLTTDALKHSFAASFTVHAAHSKTASTARGVSLTEVASTQNAQVYMIHFAPLAEDLAMPAASPGARPFYVSYQSNIPSLSFADADGHALTDTSRLLGPVTLVVDSTPVAMDVLTNTVTTGRTGDVTILVSIKELESGLDPNIDLTQLSFVLYLQQGITLKSDRVEALKGIENSTYQLLRVTFQNAPTDWYSAQGNLILVTEIQDRVGNSLPEGTQLTPQIALKMDKSLPSISVVPTSRDGEIFVHITTKKATLVDASISKEDFVITAAGKTLPIAQMQLSRKDAGSHSIMLRLETELAVGETATVGLSDTAGGISNSVGNPATFTQNNTVVGAAAHRNHRQASLESNVMVLESAYSWVFLTHKGSIELTLTATEGKTFSDDAFDHASFVLYSRSHRSKRLPLKMAQPSPTAATQVVLHLEVSGVSRSDPGRYTLKVHNNLTYTDSSQAFTKDTVLASDLLLVRKPASGRADRTYISDGNRSIYYNENDTIYHIDLTHTGKLVDTIADGVDFSFPDDGITPSSAHFVSVPDLDKDAVPELANINPSVAGGQITIRLSASKNRVQVIGPASKPIHGITAIGDLDGDTVPDFVVHGAEQSYLVLAKALKVGVPLVLPFEPTSPRATDAVRVLVDAAGNRLSVTAIGDVNGDGTEDLVVAYASSATETAYALMSAEQLYTLVRSAGQIPSFQDAIAKLQLTHLTGARAFVALGDVNGDRIGDFGVIGAHHSAPIAVIYGQEQLFAQARAGETPSYEVKVFNESGAFDATTLSGTIFKNAGSDLPQATGDLSFDGIDDMLLGRHVVFGSSKGFTYLEDEHHTYTFA